MSVWSITTIDGASAVSVYHEGQMYVAPNTHPAYATIVTKLLAEDYSCTALFDVTASLNTKFERIGNRVSLKGSQLHFDADPLNGALADHVVRLWQQGDEWESLVAFLEKVQNNPNDHSREQLYSWLTGNEFTILTNGNILAYKGVTKDLKSVYSGTAIVDGETIKGNIPNQVGSTVEMPRSSVHHDPSQGCSTGLHVATWSFAKGFADTVLEVEVDPRDVVSVPSDSGEQKMRVCRYVVRAIQFVKTPRSEAVYSGYDVEDAEARSYYDDDYDDNEDDDAYNLYGRA